MPWFNYKAARDDGEVIEGRLDAPDRSALARRLQADGQVPILIEEFRGGIEKGRSNLFAGLLPSKVGPKDVEYFTLQLATLLRAGLSLDKALETMGRLSDKPPMKELITGLGQEIRRGASLSAALERHPRHFDRFYLNMVRAGEATGAMEMALERLAEFTSRSRELRETVVSSLFYPAILIVLACVAMAVMLGFVVPQFTEMFADAGRQLPLLTRIVVAAGEFIQSFWWAILAAIGGLVYWLRQDYASTLGRERWDARMLRAPLVGELITKIEAGRFTRTLSTLLGNGVSLLTAMDIAKEIVSNRIIAQGLTRVATRVRRGEGLSRPLAEADVFPGLTNQLIRVGEETGRLEHMLEQLAEIYDR